MQKLFPLSTLLLLTLSAAAQPNFTNRSLPAGFAGTPGPNHCLAAGDFDGDGYDDLFLGRIGAPNKLFRNNQDGTFTEVAGTAGVAGAANALTYAAAWGDLDNDGDPDLYVANRDAADQLYENLGNGTFREITLDAGINNTSAPRSVNFADVDNDGLLDIFVANLRQDNRLYRNLGGLHFTDEANERGVSDNLVSMGAIFTDYDRDGDQDLYLTHDNRQPNLLLNNDGKGIFTDVSRPSGTDHAGFGMGVAAGDVNNDGWPDLYITNLYTNLLLVNNHDGTFTNRTGSAGVGDEGMGWGTTFLDADNDGREDIYVANESYFSPYPNVLYRNLGNDSFAVITDLLAEGSPFGGYAAVTTDVDHDGRTDLFVANSGQTGGLQYFHNAATNANHWLAIRPEGTRSNRDGIGVRVTVETSLGTQVREVTAGSGYASQNGRWLHFGLGRDSLISRLEIVWPSGQTDVWEAVPTNQFLSILEGGTVAASNQAEANNQPKILLYPNPASEKLFVRLPHPLTQATNLLLYNAAGQLLLHRRLAPTLIEQEVILSVAQLPPGKYLLCVEGYAGEWVVVEP